MKKLFALLLALALCFSSFVGCADTDENGREVCYIADGVTLVKVSYDYPYAVWVHKETKVMYLEIDGSYGDAYTVMLDENGKPLLWEGDL